MTQTAPTAAASAAPSAPREGAPPRPVAPAIDAAKVREVYAELERLELMAHVNQLDEQGFTIVPPEKVGPPELVERLLGAAVRIAEAESGITPDFETGATHADIPAERRATSNSLFPYQQEHGHVLFKDPAFEEFLMNPASLALVTYLLGEHAELSVAGNLWFRGPSEAPDGFVPTSLHSDNYGIPAPFAPYAVVCNATMPLTDYTRAGGCLGFIPGSHHLARHPLTTDEMLDRWVPAEAPAGSLILWHGNTWHTIGNPRTIPGLRVHLSMVFCRPYIMPINFYKDWVSPDMLERNPARFATLLGLHSRFGQDKDPRTNRRAVPEGDTETITGTPSRWD